MTGDPEAGRSAVPGEGDGFDSLQPLEAGVGFDELAGALGSLIGAAANLLDRQRIEGESPPGFNDTQLRALKILWNTVVDLGIEGRGLSRGSQEVFTHRADGIGAYGGREARPGESELFDLEELCPPSPDAEDDSVIKILDGDVLSYGGEYIPLRTRMNAIRVDIINAFAKAKGRPMNVEQLFRLSGFGGTFTQFYSTFRHLRSILDEVEARTGAPTFILTSGRRRDMTYRLGEIGFKDDRTQHDEQPADED